jgi:hypothetical protein
MSKRDSCNDLDEDTFLECADETPRGYPVTGNCAIFQDFRRTKVDSARSL